MEAHPATLWEAHSEVIGERTALVRGPVRRAFGVARRAFGLARRLCRGRLRALGRPPDRIDFLDFRGVVAARRFVGRLRDFLFALLGMTASLLQQP